LAALACCGVLAMPHAALADRGEVSLAGSLGAALPVGVTAELSGRYGLTDFSAVTAQVGALGDVRDAWGAAQVGVVVLFDVVAWVPEFSVLTGLASNGSTVRPVGTVTVGVRRFVSMDVSLGGYVSLRATGRELAGVAGLTVSRLFD